MAEAMTQVYLCHEVLSRTDIQPLLTGPFEGEMGLVDTLLGLSDSVDDGYGQWCNTNGPNNFCAVFDYEVTPVVANRIADYMLSNRQTPAGSVIVSWTVGAMDEANALQS